MPLRHSSSFSAFVAPFAVAQALSVNAVYLRRVKAAASTVVWGGWGEGGATFLHVGHLGVDDAFGPLQDGKDGARAGGAEEGLALGQGLVEGGPKV